MYTEDYTTVHIPFWRDLFKSYRDRGRQSPITMLEIGSFEGRSTAWFLQNVLHHPQDKIHCIDPHWYNPGDAESKFWRSVINANGVGKLVKHKRQSERVMPGYEEKAFDIIYVDGNHDGLAVLLDALNSFRVCKIGGIILFDDYLMPAKTEHWNFANSTKKAIDTFSDFYRKSLQLIAEDNKPNCSQIAFRRSGQ
jgi:predicted O-methyltransferase YrrM